MSAALIIAGKLAASGKTTKIIIILGISTGKSRIATNSSQNSSNYIVYFS